MKFTFTTVYDQKALKAMAKGLRKTVRKKRSRRSHVFGWVVIGLGLLLSVSTLLNDGFGAKVMVTWSAIAVILIALIWEDGLNAYIGRKRMLPGTELATAVFEQDGFVSETEVGTTKFAYDKITALAEDERYFIFLFHKNHAQAYDKSKMEGGTEEEFRVFIETMTALSLVKI